MCIGGLRQLLFLVRNVSDLWIYIALEFCKVYSDLGSFAGHINGYSHGEYEDLMHITDSSSTVLLSSVNKTGYGLEGQGSIPGVVMIFSTPTFVPIYDRDIPSSRHAMKGCVQI
jgi:hypothetical protein